jgi:murein DD-endopeptidase MepM/ murein hydrolase activator NlpD
MSQIFEQMASTCLLSKKKYLPPPALAEKPRIASTFDFPVNPPSGGASPPWFAGYNQRNPYLTNLSTCFGKPYSQLQHTAEDWFRPAGAPVFAAANGLVVYSEESSYPGAVVIIEHELPDEWQNTSGVKRIYSVYGHLDTNGLVSAWSQIQRGQYIGRLLDQGQNSHLHFEIRTVGDMTGVLICPSNQQTSWAGPGYTDTNDHPANYGYHNPTIWINNHRMKSTRSIFFTSKQPRAE